MALAPVCVLLAAAVVAVTSARDPGPTSRPAAEAAAGAAVPPADRQATAVPQAAAPVPVPLEGAEGGQTIARGALTIRMADPAAVEAGAARAREIAASVGGHTVRESYRGGAEGPTVATVTLRLPVERYDDARAALAAVGTVVEESAEFAGPATSPAPRADRPTAPPAAGTATIQVTFVTP
jgi:hypothetical protein